MTVGLLRIRLRLTSRSLKEKRTIVKSVVERVRTRFNASAAEVGDLDTWDSATIAVAVVSNEAAHADAMLQTIANYITAERVDAELLDIETELISV
ncbi:MAG: DUF503 domain-containing protein [Dehalococcoidia bacterium]